MKVLIISSNYYPEPMGIGLYTTDLAENLLSQGHSVSVLTNIPYYPWWKTPSEHIRHLECRSEISGVNVHRVKLKIPSQPKLFARLSFEIRMWLKMKARAKEFVGSEIDMVVSIIPSLGPGLVGTYLSRRNSIPHKVVVQDITSKGVTQSGMSLGGGLQTITRKVETRILRNAVAIAVVANPMKKIVCSLIKTDIKVSVIPNYSVTQQSSYSARVNVRQFLDLPQDKFLVIYTGSIAQKQNLMNLLNAARILREENSIHVVVFGHGNSESDLKDHSQNLLNFEVRPSVSLDIYHSLLQSADLLVLNERSSQIEMALPSKIVSYFESGTPVVAAVPVGGASYEILANHSFVVDSDNPKLLAQMILAAKDNPAQSKAFARAALEYYRENLTFSAGREKYLEWVTG